MVMIYHYNDILPICLVFRKCCNLVETFFHFQVIVIVIIEINIIINAMYHKYIFRVCQKYIFLQKSVTEGQATLKIQVNFYDMARIGISMRILMISMTMLMIF